ncbi:MAG: hypothetical protein LBQ76_00870 [Candidatus Fibromonas sp.]|jgi:hypothetical protein|nr:hypothetical protein [Candidatus Fibromonas sp.]
MKKYSVHLILLVLAAGLIILGACGSGEVIDLSDVNSDEYRNWDDARINLTDDGGLIEHCSGASETSEYCEEFRVYSSSSEEEASSSSEEDTSSSSEEGISASGGESSSSVGVSSSSLPKGAYPIPSFTCRWEPSTVEVGGNAQLRVEFNPPNVAAEVDCEKEAWLGVNKPNELGGLSNKYDTLRFVLNKNYSTSGAVLGSAVQWPVNGEFKGDLPIEEITASKNASKIIGSTVTCENTKEGKNIFTAWKNCEPLFVGTRPSSSSEAPSSSSEASSSSSSSIASSSSSTAPSSSSVAPSSSSTIAPSSSSVAPSSGSVAPTLTCATITPTEKKVGVAFARPAVTCGTASVTTGLNWTPAASLTVSGTNLTPTATGNIQVGVSVSSGTCSGQSATCGSITVAQADIACTKTATTGTVGTAITPAPTVSCNGTNVANSNLTWTPANYIPTVTGSVAVSATVGTNGYCAGRTVQCGNITVSAPGGCKYQNAWCNNLYTNATSVPKEKPVVGNQSASNRCFFVTEITTYCANNAATTLVNGEPNTNNINCWGKNGNLPAKADGGYYIYLPLNTALGEFEGTAGGAPVCN